MKRKKISPTKSKQGEWTEASHFILRENWTWIHPKYLIITISEGNDGLNYNRMTNRVKKDDFTLSLGSWCKTSARSARVKTGVQDRLHAGRHRAQASHRKKRVKLCWCEGCSIEGGALCLCLCVSVLHSGVRISLVISHYRCFLRCCVLFEWLLLCKSPRAHLSRW